jgi:hypothetical protein
MAECIAYADGTSDWGPVVVADVLLGNGNERAANVPIQLINSTYGQIPSDCTKPDSSPSVDGYNGILGVGLFAQDCGAGCASNANNRLYFSCKAGTPCAPIAVSTALQVINPVLSLPSGYNNGVILQLANVPSSGASLSSGFMVLGIGSQADNTPPSGVTVIPADANGNLGTIFNGQVYTGSFIDSGSNGLYFPDTAITACTAANDAGLFCPTAAVNLSGTQYSNSGGKSQVIVPFQIDDADLDYSLNYGAFPGYGGNVAGGFDWGLPFFFGKTVYIGLETKSSSLGTGTYWAY